MTDTCIVESYKDRTCECGDGLLLFFFEKKIYFHKTNLQKNHTYNTIHTIYRRKEIKAKKRLEILKKEEKEIGVAIMSFKQSRDIIRSSCSAYIHFMQSTR